MEYPWTRFTVSWSYALVQLVRERNRAAFHADLPQLLDHFHQPSSFALHRVISAPSPTRTSDTTNATQEQSNQSMRSGRYVLQPHGSVQHQHGLHYSAHRSPLTPTTPSTHLIMI